METVTRGVCATPSSWALGFAFHSSKAPPNPNEVLWEDGCPLIMGLWACPWLLQRVAWGLSAVLCEENHIRTLYKVISSYIVRRL